MKLALFFTDGVSLHTWDSVGMLEREVALYKELRTLEVEIEFVTYGGAADREFGGRLAGIDIRANSFGLPARLYKSSLALWPPKADVFKSNQLPGADTALCAARKAKAAFVARSGYLPSLMDAIRYGEDSAQARSARDYEARLLPQADRVVVTTAFAAEEVVQRYGVSPERVRVIPNYVETERFAPKPAAATSRFKIGCIGRLDYQKNLPALVEAVSPLDVELVLVGEGPQKAHLAELAKAARAKITLAGNLPNQDLPALLGTLDLFVLPSFYEGHPKALIEAMSCGLPVIGARVQGIRELITDELNGLLCEADAVSIRAAIQRVMEDAALAKRIGQAAREYVLSNFSLPRVVEQELALLTELA